MRKTQLIIMLVLALCVSAKTVYLNTGGTSLWETGGADKFAVWYWQGANNGTWSAFMTRVSGNVWKTDISDAADHVIFVRCNTSFSSPGWPAWNKTEDLSIPSGKDLYTIAAWGQNTEVCPGMWSTYGGSSTPVVPETPQDFASAVPSQCEDVMLQAFYWDSNKGGQSGDNYGDTKWATLLNQADEISDSFDLVWLAPSAASAKNGEIGYVPAHYTNQNSSHGFKLTLQTLINTLHAGGTRVLADIVINHCGNKGSWCDYWELDFGQFGTFQPTSQWITANDEGASQCSVGPNQDDGQDEPKNWGSARDWDHKNTQVQAMCRAYLQWIRNELNYDGFRYDYCKGYHVSHINDYNTAAKPYFSVMEYWDGSAAKLATRIDEAGKNTLAFDFANRYTAFRDGIRAGAYSNCKAAGMRGRGYSKYAVTFVDNHDTFHRTGDGDPDIANVRDGSSINNKSLVLQCNAYILSLPGVPCVFWPHWVKYKSDIKAMIHARKMAGVHSESTMTEEAGSGYYRATVQGKYGSVKLMLGTAAADAAPAGYTKAVKSDTYAVYYTGTGNPAQGMERVQDKSVQLDPQQPMYNLLGQPVTPDYRGIIIQNGRKFFRN